MPYRCIGLIGKYDNPEITEPLIREVVQWLQQNGYQVLLDQQSVSDQTGGRRVERSVLGNDCDLVLVLGGDGTFLGAARHLVDYRVSVMGVNMGRLGFLATCSPDALFQCLPAILQGDGCEETRQMLSVRVLRDDQVVFSEKALNDVVINNRGMSRMLEFETFVNGVFLMTQRADGMIVATPTGSTAYALSGGGPIMHPTLAALVMVPICSHSLTNRPIVIDAGSHVESVLGRNYTAAAQVTCDGQISFLLEPADRVVVNRKSLSLRIVHPPDYDYYRLLRSKLGWGDWPAARQ